MALFGFLGRFPGPVPFETLTEYGETFARASGLTGPSARMTGAYGVWAPRLAESDGISVAFEGEPLALDGGLAWADPAAAAGAILAAYRKRGVDVLQSLG